VSLLIAGCGSEPEPIDGCLPSQEPTLEVGKGEDQWLPASADEGRTVLIHGFQGGYHSFVSLRSTGLSVQGAWKIELAGYLAGAEVVRVPLEREPACNAGVAQGESLGTWLIWGTRPDQLDLLHQQPVRIEARVEDLDGREASASAEMLLWSELSWEDT
jgi:hypothetical protein